MRLNLVVSLAVSLIAASSFAEEQPTRVKQPLQAAVKQAVAVNPRGNFGYLIPTEVDPNHKTERVLLFAPTCPLLIELSMTIDGQPFQTPREQMINEALQGTDPDKDGKTTWEEILAKPGLVGGRFAYLGQNEEVKKRTIAQMDQNKDGFVDRFELRTLFAGYTGGPAFMVQAGFGQQNPPVRELLDINKDNVLQAEEIAAAPARLKSRDANDNDIVDLAELTGNAAAAYGGGNGRGVAMQQQVLVVHLHDKVNWSSVYDLLSKKYGQNGKLTAESFSLAPDLVKRLDGNNNGHLDKDELSALLVMEPHLVYEVNLGDSGNLLSGGVLQIKSPTLAALTKLTPGETITLETPGARVQFAVSNPKPNYGNLDGYATQLLNNYDKDKNGYIEKEELGPQAQLVQQFAGWDLDGDGKVYAAEIKASYERQQVPTWQRVTVNAADQGNSLFSLLDGDNNSRLSLREIHTAAERLKKADNNNDGQITLDEIPGTVRLTVSRGNGYAGGRFAQVGGGRVVAGAQNTRPAGPAWFIHMDKNGDGDITPREFLGEVEQFKQLDTNVDGFIEIQEAEAVK